MRTAEEWTGKIAAMVHAGQDILPIVQECRLETYRQGCTDAVISASAVGISNAAYEALLALRDCKKLEEM